MNSMDGFNKHTHNGHGTLVCNWFEERNLRDHTGEGRTIAGKHTAKTREGLFNCDPKTLARDVDPRANTTSRTMPDSRLAVPDLTSTSYGRHDTRVSRIQTNGMRHQLIEKQFLQQANQDYHGWKTQFDSEKVEMRTTYGSEHYKRPFS